MSKFTRRRHKHCLLGKVLFTLGLSIYEMKGLFFELHTARGTFDRVAELHAATTIGLILVVYVVRVPQGAFAHPADEAVSVVSFPTGAKYAKSLFYIAKASSACGFSSLLTHSGDIPLATAFELLFTEFRVIQCIANVCDFLSDH